MCACQQLLLAELTAPIVYCTQRAGTGHFISPCIVQFSRGSSALADLLGDYVLKRQREFERGVVTDKKKVYVPMCSFEISQIEKRKKERRAHNEKKGYRAIENEREDMQVIKSSNCVK